MYIIIIDLSSVTAAIRTAGSVARDNAQGLVANSNLIIIIFSRNDNNSNDNVVLISCGVTLRSVRLAAARRSSWSQTVVVPTRAQTHNNIMRRRGRTIARAKIL